MALPALLSPVEFNANYVHALQQGDPAAEEHFVSHFSPILSRKLRKKLRSADMASDLRQETFLRVLTALRSEQGVRQPERFEVFVMGVCNNILRETYRNQKEFSQLQPEFEPASVAPSPYASVVARETGTYVRKVLSRLEPDVRAILQAVYLEEQGRDEICRRFGIKRGYLRLLIYRAKKEFGVVQKQLKNKTKPRTRRTRGSGRHVLSVLQARRLAPRSETVCMTSMVPPPLVATNMSGNCWL